MRVIVLSLLMMMVPSLAVIYDFGNVTNGQGEWRIVDDRVMGGRSQGYFEINEEGQGHFHGGVSLENNGGFSSVRYRLPEAQAASDQQLVRLRVKGDGKRYQFRVKAKASDYYSYITYFETSGEWEEIELDLEDFYPSFRGQKLKMPNFDQAQIEELSILIANYKKEEFNLLIDKIELD